MWPWRACFRRDGNLMYLRMRLHRRRFFATGRGRSCSPVLRSGIKSIPAEGQLNPGLKIVRCSGHMNFVWKLLKGKKWMGDLPGIRQSEEHTSELQSRGHLVCRLLLEKQKK